MSTDDQAHSADPSTGIGTPTGWVIATPDLAAARRLWEDGLGLRPEPAGSAELTALRHPGTGQAVTLVEFTLPDPPVAVAVRTTDVEASVTTAGQHGLTEYWRSTADSGTEFVMVQNGRGVFVLLYQLPAR